MNAKFSHRTRANTAAIEGLSASIARIANKINYTMLTGGELELQSLLANLDAEYKAIEIAIVEQEQ